MLSRRKALRLSRARLAQLAGVTAAVIQRLETWPNPSWPERTTVTRLAHALRLDVDESLALVARGYEGREDYGPLTDDERAHLAATIDDPRAQLDLVLDDMTPQQLQALLVHLQAMLYRGGAPAPNGDPSGVWSMHVPADGPDDVHRTARDREPSNGD